MLESHPGTRTGGVHPGQAEGCVPDPVSVVDPGHIDRPVGADEHRVELLGGLIANQTGAPGGANPVPVRPVGSDQTAGPTVKLT